MTSAAGTQQRVVPRPILALACFGALLVLAGVLWSVIDREPSPPTWALQGGAAVPRIDLPDLRDPTRRFNVPGTESLPIVMNVFSSTCAPCVEELPIFERLARELSGEVRVVGIDHLDRRAAGLALLNRTGVTFPVGFDETGRLSTDYRLAGLPATFFIHADGTLADSVLGPIGTDELHRKAKGLRRAY